MPHPVLLLLLLLPLLLLLFQHGVEGVKVILVGNKVDLEETRKVTTRRGQKVTMFVGQGLLQ